MQASIAIEEADVIIFVVDAKDGLTSNDLLVRDLLRKYNKKVVVAINKVDILVVLLPSFFLAIILAFFTPNTFLSLAFDSLGAVIGTISSSFLLPILIGITNSSLQTFGYVAFIGIIPVIFLEIAGFIYEKEIILHDYNQLDDEVVIYV